MLRTSVIYTPHYNGDELDRTYNRHSETKAPSKLSVGNFERKKIAMLEFTEVLEERIACIFRVEVLSRRCSCHSTCLRD
jgi:hypothetical protein